MTGSKPPENSQSRRAVLHRAAWLVPISTRSVPNGAVIEDGRSILAVGTYRDVRRQCPPGTPEIDHGSAALMPALVNAHTHLELSGLAGTIPLPQPGFPAWLKELFSKRPRLAAEDRARAVARAAKDLTRFGTGFFGDHTNGDADGLPQDPFGPWKIEFREVIGFDRDSLAASFAGEIPKQDDTAERYGEVSLAAHACYSTSAGLIREAKAWTRKARLPFSIHVAEHPEEMEFLKLGTGFCRGLLERLGKWDPAWKAPGVSPVRYLDGLKVLDKDTLLVHAVHMEDADWPIVAGKGCTICFCPRSNHFLGVGRPDPGKALRLGIPVALGTDSLAGNTDLNLFNEAAFLLEHFPDVSPADILIMATSGGAGALGRGSVAGSLEPGRKPLILEVSLPGSLSASQLAEAVIHNGSKGALRWVSHPVHC